MKTKTNKNSLLIIMSILVIISVCLLQTIFEYTGNRYVYAIPGDSYTSGTVTVQYNVDIGSGLICTLDPDGAGIMDDYGSVDNVPWSAKLDQMDGIYINDNITHIGSYAFYGSNGAEIVKSTNYNADGVTSVGAYAFYGCPNITYTDFPNLSVENIGEHAFDVMPSPAPAPTPATGVVTDVVMPTILVLITGFVAAAFVLQSKKSKQF